MRCRCRAGAFVPKSGVSGITLVSANEIPDFGDDMFSDAQERQWTIGMKFAQLFRLPAKAP